MKKPYILIISIVASILVFFVLLSVFKGVKSYIVNQYKPEYITASPKDSLYMKLLNNLETREEAMNVSREVQGFYFLTDSMKTILEAKISPELISDIIINKGLAQEMKTHLYHLDTSNIISCIPSCLDASEADDSAWQKLFEEKQPKEIRAFVQGKIDLVVEGEKVALLGVK